MSRGLGDVYKRQVNREPIHPGRLHTHVLAVVLSQPGGTPPEVSCKGAKPLAFVGGNALLVD